MEFKKKGRISETRYEMARSLIIGLIARRKGFYHIAFKVYDETWIDLSCNLKMKQFLKELIAKKIETCKNEIDHFEEIERDHQHYDSFKIYNAKAQIAKEKNILEYLKTLNDDCEKKF